MADQTKNPVKKSSVNVIFWKIEESYLINTDVTVHYTISNDMEVSSRDWIGLYRVGWRSYLDYIYYEWSPADKSGLKTENKVVFPAKKLPKDDEFYQFCYVTHSGQVQGASTPFQFKSIIVDDLVEDEDESNGIVVVKTKTSFLEDSLEKANNATLMLKKKIEFLEGEIDLLLLAEKDLSKKLREAKEEEENLKSSLEETNELLSEQKQANNHLQDCIKSFQEKIEVLEQEKHSMEKRLDDSDLYVASLQEKIKTLVTEKDMLNGHVKVIEEQLKTLFQEQEMLRNKLSEEELKNATFRKEQEQNALNLSIVKKEYDDEVKLSANYKNQIAGLLERVKNAEDKFRAAEHCKVMLNEEVLSMKASQEESILNCKALHQKVEYLTKTVADLNEVHAEETEDLVKRHVEQNDLLASKMEEITQLEIKCEKLETEIENVKTQREAESLGSLYALQVAHDTLVERYANLSKKFEAQQKMYCTLKLEKKELEVENTEMKDDIKVMRERVILCQRAYKEKHAECELLRNHQLKNGTHNEPDSSREEITDCKDLCEQKEKLKKYKKMLWENAEKNEELSKLLDEKDKEIENLTLALNMLRSEALNEEADAGQDKNNVITESAKDEYLEFIKTVEGLTLCQHCHISIDGCDETIIRNHYQEHEREAEHSVRELYQQF